VKIFTVDGNCLQEFPFHRQERNGMRMKRATNDRNVFDAKEYNKYVSTG
jgi:hypothetical protein